MKSFDDYRSELDSMSHNELYLFYKRYNSYIVDRVILKQPNKWKENVRKNLDEMSQEELNEFNKSFKTYIQHRLVPVGS